MPESGMAVNVDEALEIAHTASAIPLMVASFIRSRRHEVWRLFTMMTMMKVYMTAAVGVTPDRPILIDRFLHHATECEADAISRRQELHLFPLLWSISSLQRIHSGDSACILPLFEPYGKANHNNQGLHKEALPLK